MTILVTGGAGYIGSHCVLQLTDTNRAKVVVYDNLSTGSRDLVHTPYFIQGDVLDRKRLVQTMRKFDVTAVMHFAAATDVKESVENPAQYYEQNILGTMTLLQAMAECQVNRLIYSSSCSVYGSPRYIPMDENHPFDPVNPYGYTKRAVERMLSDFSYAYGLQYVSLRYFNAAGADPDTRVGEMHEPEGHIIPLVLQALSGRQPEFTIHGIDYDTPDGTCIRDFVHVADITQAHILALDYLEEDGRSTVYNIGLENGYSVREVIRAAEEVARASVTVKEGPRRPGDPPVLVASAKKIREELNWEPKYSDLEAIIETAWNWEQFVVDSLDGHD